MCTILCVGSVCITHRFMKGTPAGPLRERFVSKSSLWRPSRFDSSSLCFLMGRKFVLLFFSFRLLSEGLLRVISLFFGTLWYFQVLCFSFGKVWALHVCLLLLFLSVFFHSCFIILSCFLLFYFVCFLPFLLYYSVFLLFLACFFLFLHSSSFVLKVIIMELLVFFLNVF